MRIPIACTLAADDAADRVEEWRSFLRGSVTAAERVDDRFLRLRLAEGGEALLGAADLARREKACCGFFGFSIEIEADGWWLAVRVPADATGILSELAAQVPSTGSQSRKS